MTSEIQQKHGLMAMMRNPFAWLARRSLSPPSREMLALFSSGPTVAGVTVEPSTAVTVPAVFSCCQVLAEDLARTPIKLRQKVDDDTYVDAVDHPLWEILHDLANPELTAFGFKSAMQWSLLLFGRAYAEIVRVDERVTSLWPLDPSAMRVDRNALRVKRWTYTGNGETYSWLFDPSMPPILELTHESPVVRCRELIGNALALQDYLGTFFANGGRPSGIITAAGQIAQETADRLQASWATKYSGAKNAFRTPVFESGLKYEPITMEHDSAQLNELQRTLNEQIAGAFRVPPWKIGDLSKANYSNMEAGELAYVTSSLDPIFECWTQALQRDLLTTRQFGQYSIEFDRHALVRNDIKSLNDSLARGIQNGYLSQNDARKALGLNPIEGGDVYRVNQALAPVSQEEPRVA
jgi:HK97 family phage portal protein